MQSSDREKTIKPLYVIRKKPGAKSSIYDELIAHLENKGFLNEPHTIEINDDGIHFQHNLKEISIFLYDFLQDILDHDKIHRLSFLFKDVPPGFNEYWLFDMKAINESAGIEIHKYQQDSVLNRARQKRKAVKDQFKDTDFEEMKMRDHPVKAERASTANKQLLEQYSHHDGVCIGEHHHRHDHKKFLVSALPSLSRTGMTDLFVEFSFYDTQNQLYQYFHETGLMPATLLAYLVMEDKNLGLIPKDQDDLIATYQSQPYSNLGIVVMAQMQQIRVTPIDQTDTYDSMSTHLAKGLEKFGKKRNLSMNPAAAGIIEATRREKFIALVGEDHNITNVASRSPGLSALLDIPNIKLNDFENFEECDAFTRALLVHNISRVLMGKPVRVYSQPAYFPEDDPVTCQKLIYLLELKSELDAITWKDRHIAILKQLLAMLDHVNNTDAINSLFRSAVNELQNAHAANKKTDEMRTFYLDKFLQGTDVVNSGYRRENFPETCPPILNVQTTRKSIDATEINESEKIDQDTIIDTIRNEYIIQRKRFIKVINGKKLATMFNPDLQAEMAKGIKNEFLQLIRDHLPELNDSTRLKLLEEIKKWENEKKFIRHYRIPHFYNVFIDTDTWRELKKLLTTPLQRKSSLQI